MRARCEKSRRLSQSTTFTVTHNKLLAIPVLMFPFLFFPFFCLLFCCFSPQIFGLTECTLTLHTENASRRCNFNGRWDNYTNYDLCQHVPGPSSVPEFEPGIELPTLVYYTGYCLSLLSLSMAVAVFLHFK